MWDQRDPHNPLVFPTNPLLGGPWGLVTTYNWAYNPRTLLIIPLNGLIGVTPLISRVTLPVRGNY